MNFMDLCEGVEFWYTVRYMQLCLREKFNSARENNFKPLFVLISVRILLKQLDYSLSISMRR